MKALLGVIVVAALGIGAWILFSGGTEVPDQAPQTSSSEPETSEETATETAEDAVDEAEEAASEAVEQVEDALDDLKEQAETAAEAVKTEVEEVVTEAEEKVDAVTEAVKQQAEEAVEQGSEKVQSAIAKALGAASGADGAESAEIDPEANLEHDADKTGGVPDLADALSVDGFDGIAIREALAASDLNALAKASVESLITVGEENPEQLQEVLPKIREMLGL